uniref:Uncharacterized protein n=1 Tax=Anguilla anguilla TaxID=7936 RepID=A0A0E9R9X4_ANGAN
MSCLLHSRFAVPVIPAFDWSDLLSDNLERHKTQCNYMVDKTFVCEV